MDAQLALHLDTARPVLSLESLDSEEQAVARVLRWGRAHALQVRDIAAAAHLPVRTTQRVIKRLLHDWHWPIGTSMAHPCGNYLIDSAAELEATVELLRDRAIAELARAAALRRMSLRAYLATVQTDLVDALTPEAA